jgi:hypothetical protein
MFVIQESDVVGKTFYSYVLTEMTFRFEGGGVTIKGLTGSRTEIKSETWASCAAGRGERDVPGHVIKRQWGGPGQLPSSPGYGIFAGNAPFINLVPLSNSVNQGGWKTHEQDVETWATQYEVLCVRILIYYDKEGEYPARPSRFKIEYMWKDDQGTWGAKPSKEFPNTY